MKKYVYAFRLRPPGPGCQPMEGLIQISTEPDIINGRPWWGKAIYNRELTDKETDDYDLKYIRTIEEQEET